ncbi:hypothetical protein [Glycomyces sp. MUSA5-2]|uniref:hypothetical protein n=1 Tax=Glycomyces sp. MUSA5-2 TaxID=2053002 RepID=UPI00300B8DA7
MPAQAHSTSGTPKTRFGPWVPQDTPGSDDRPTPGWSDWVGLVLCTLAFTGYFLQAARALEVPDSGFVTDLNASSWTSGCTYIGRIYSCRDDIDYDLLEQPVTSSCRRIEFVDPSRFFHGTDCVEEEVWENLEVGDVYVPEG